jgi:hypothetical protein
MAELLVVTQQPPNREVGSKTSSRCALLTASARGGCLTLSNKMRVTHTTLAHSAIVTCRSGTPKVRRKYAGSSPQKDPPGEMHHEGGLRARAAAAPDLAEAAQGAAALGSRWKQVGGPGQMLTSKQEHAGRSALIPAFECLHCLSRPLTSTARLRASASQAAMPMVIARS